MFCHFSFCRRQSFFRVFGTVKNYRRPDLDAWILVFGKSSKRLDAWDLLLTSNFGIDVKMDLSDLFWCVDFDSFDFQYLDGKTSIHLWTRRFGLLLFKFGRVEFRWISMYVNLIKDGKCL
ncbi:hypothetical protein RclHR1_00440017 [Rhizophagus clarus]|uniref:Uncharacterized protein n=1 Tax=Rhizophagus clarus TaxID=94130 RepID=A0A2Z6RIP9_9GLOM|nr:hypothetical protein RclHR1_00440017 [Rhizophagus clarus]